jgi:predicted O-methyltransferase YrrM
LLYRIARFYQCCRIVELGTSLGITTTYLALAAGKEGQVVTAEGAPALARRAQAHFLDWGLDQVQVVEGAFDEHLDRIRESVPYPDLVFIDGNHRKDPTLHYFEAFLPGMGEEGILVFDDIHWSREMEEAWDEIRRHPAVRCTVDLFFIGLVFFRTGFREQQHFSIRFS